MPYSLRFLGIFAPLRENLNHSRKDTKEADALLYVA